MIDKELFKLIGKNKKYIFLAVGLQILGLLANVGITASVCWAIGLCAELVYPKTHILPAVLIGDVVEAVDFIYPAIVAVVCIAIRYATTRLTGDVKDVLGRKVKKDLRESTYEKIVKLGVRSTDG
ncbi:MAG: hypothetical protein K2I29_00720, partial [Clostridia bacterium]|nr:hypothetical protein [Clostridia bacterium]